MKLKTIERIIDFLVLDLDIEIGFDQDEWRDVIQFLQEKFGENSSLTQRRIEKYINGDYDE